MKICSVRGCARPAPAKELCSMHYRRQRRKDIKDGAPNRVNKGSYLNNGYVVIGTVNGAHLYEHIFIAEKALGKKLPAGAVVHHMNKNKTDNYTPFNLVICPSQAYHMLLHSRMKELGYE